MNILSHVIIKGVYCSVQCIVHIADFYGKVTEKLNRSFFYILSYNKLLISVYTYINN